MRRPIQKVFVFAVSIFAIILIAGCEEEYASNTKRDRLIAVENAQLKKDLESRTKENEEQKKLLEKCEQEKKDLRARLPMEFKGQIDKIMNDLTQDNKLLRDENKELKSQIEKLEKELK